MTRRIAFVFLLALAGFARANPAGTVETPEAGAVAQGPVESALGRAIDQVLASEFLAKSQASVEVLRLGPARGQDQIIYSRNAQQPLIPASNLKLVSTAAAIHFLGGDFQFNTRLVIRTLPQGTTDAAILGDGDPTTGDSELFAPLGIKVNATFAQWADILKQQGVTRLDKLYVDDSVFGDEHFHPNWPVDQAHLGYVAQVGGLNLNANCLDVYLAPVGGQIAVRTEPATRFVNLQNRVTVGNGELALSRTLGTNNIVARGERRVTNRQPWRVTIHDPPMFAVTVAAETFASHGIHVGDVAKDNSARLSFETGQSPWQLVAQVQTPLSIVLDHANKESANLYAEALARRTAFKVYSDGSWSSASKALARFLSDIGIDASEYTVDDGCGLSRKNRISASALTRILAHMHHSPDRQLFHKSLSQGGVDGTLARRFNDPLLSGKVAGKSGFVRGVSSLSGYIQSRDGNTYVFSILLNNVPIGQNATAKNLQDKIVAAIEESTVAK